MDDRDLPALCVYAMWDMEPTDRFVRRLLNPPCGTWVGAAELRKIGEAIVANPKRTKTTLRIYTRAIANRLDGK